MAKFLINAKLLVRNLVHYILNELSDIQSKKITNEFTAKLGKLGKLPRLTDLRNRNPNLLTKHKLPANSQRYYYERCRLLLHKSLYSTRASSRKYSKQAHTAKPRSIPTILNTENSTCDSEDTPATFKLQEMPNAAFNLQKLIDEVEIETHVYSELMDEKLAKPHEVKKAAFKKPEPNLKLSPKEPGKVKPASIEPSTFDTPIHPSISATSSTSSFYSCKSTQGSKPPTEVPLMRPKTLPLRDVQHLANRMNIITRDKLKTELKNEKNPDKKIGINESRPYKVDSYLNPKSRPQIDPKKNPLLVEQQKHLEFLHNTLRKSAEMRSDTTAMAEIQTMTNVTKKPKRSSLLTMSKRPTKPPSNTPPSVRVPQENEQRIAPKSYSSFVKKGPGTRPKITSIGGIPSGNIKHNAKEELLYPMIQRQFCNLGTRFSFGCLGNVGVGKETRKVSGNNKIDPVKLKKRMRHGTKPVAIDKTSSLNQNKLLNPKLKSGKAFAFHRKFSTIPDEANDPEEVRPVDVDNFAEVRVKASVLQTHKINPVLDHSGFVGDLISEDIERKTDPSVIKEPIPEHFVSTTNAKPDAVNHHSLDHDAKEILCPTCLDGVTRYMDYSSETESDHFKTKIRSMVDDVQKSKKNMIVESE